MGLSVKQKWVSLVLFSIVIPVGLLSGFRLIGVLREPVKPETITVDTVFWNMSRPLVHRKGINIVQWANNSFNEHGVSLDFSLLICSYFDNTARFSDNVDYVDFVMVVGANLSDGFVQSVFIEFSGIDAQAYLDIVVALNDPDWVEVHNLKIKSVRDLLSVDQPYIEAYGVSQPKTCSLTMRAYWYFFDENNLDHGITATLEIHFFNGTTYLRVIIPISLGVFTS